MQITAQMVKELREKTGAGMMDCKKALTEANGDISAAMDLLREKGIAKAGKKSDRIAAEGLTKVLVKGNDAVIIELNSETDFVAKNEQFLTLLDTVANALVGKNINDVEAALNVEVDGETIANIIVLASATIGEKLDFRRITSVTKTDTQVFGSYSHGGKISVVSVLEGGTEELAKQVCMHAASEKPQVLNVEDVSEETVTKERQMLLIEAIREQIFKTVIKEEGIKPINLTPERETQVNVIVDERFDAVFAEQKDSDMIKNIVNGKVNKFFKEVCLNEQMSIFDNKKAMKQFVAEQGASIVSFARYEVGEGIEKKADNFAEEVMNQVRGQ